MIKKSILVRELKRYKLIQLHKNKRLFLKKQSKNINSLSELFLYYKKIQKLPRNSSKIRSHNRCYITSRAHGYYKYFGLSRIILKKFALQGILPGIIKSSW